MLELDQIQGLVVRGYRMEHSRLLFLEFDSAEEGRAWLREIEPEVRTAEAWIQKPNTCLNLALSLEGLVALGLGPSALTLFGAEFLQGMIRRARFLGDVGASAPENWNSLLAAVPNPVHALLLMFGRRDDQGTDRLLTELVTREKKRAHKYGLRLLLEEVGRAEGAAQGEFREHFGGRDGISQPTIAELPDRRNAGAGPPAGAQPPVKAGEFVLGYPDEVGWPGYAPSASALGDSLLKNGSFLVYRKLEQDVAAFRQFLAKHAADREEATALHAALVGRWPNGAPLVLAPRQDDPALARENAFGYQTADPLGLSCPFGAHIRRVNPRDDLQQSNRHRLMRRGMPYGKVLGPEDPVDATQERGILGLFLNGSLDRQFEFVQSAWANNPSFRDLYNEVDPLTHDRTGAPGLTLPIGGEMVRIAELPAFITLRAGGYFFVPGRNGLRYLSDPFFPAYDLADPQQRTALIGEWQRDRPAALYAEMRKHRRTVTMSTAPDAVTYVADAAGVREVLAGQGPFQVRRHREKMLALVGPFILGMEPGAAYSTDKAGLERVVKREDLRRIALLAQDRIQAEWKEVKQSGVLNVTAALGRTVPISVAARYFGLPGPDGECAERTTLLRWTRALFHDIFANPKNDPSVHEVAKTAASEWKGYLGGLIAERKHWANHTGSYDETVLDRLLMLQQHDSHWTDRRIRDNLIGLIVGAIDTSNTFLSLALDQLLSRPQALANATTAAHENRMDDLFGYVLEALRFSPTGAGLTRFFDEAVRLNDGSGRRIEPGYVIAVTPSAMMDPQRFSQPLRFAAPDSAMPSPVPRDPAAYLHFGDGVHTCFGRHIAQVQITETLAAILRLPKLRRAPGPEGRLRLGATHPFPESLLVRFDVT